MFLIGKIESKLTQTSYSGFTLLMTAVYNTLTMLNYTSQLCISYK